MSKPLRLTPEQLDVAAEKLEDAYVFPFNNSDLIAIAKQAAHDARTLEDIRAWTKSAATSTHSVDSSVTELAIKIRVAAMLDEAR